jgi:hypothetical protein
MEQEYEELLPNVLPLYNDGKLIDYKEPFDML